MACNSVLQPEKDLLVTHVERIASSSVLQNTESLCRLLRYLARYTVENPGTHLKEYQIATEVFGRRSDFDPQGDSTVRVQVGRLRQKLQEYYHSEGAQEAVRVELPKGSYTLALHRQGHVLSESLPQIGREQPVPEPARDVRKSATAVVALSLLLAAA